jgi:hypothetical protein
MEQKKLADSATIATTSHHGASVKSLGHDEITRTNAGSTM